MSLDPDRVRRALAEGERLARNKYPDREHMRRSYAVVLAALNLSPRPRRDVELACGIGARTIEDMVTREGRTFSLAVVAPMLMDPRVLGAEVQRWFVQRWVAMLDDIGVLDQAFSELDEPELEALDVPDAGGFVASLVRAARDPDSDGGRGITPKESDQIRGAARVVEHELDQLTASCDRAAGRGAGLGAPAGRP